MVTLLLGHIGMKNSYFNCHELESSTLGFLRSLRSPRSNDLETQNDENSKWKLKKTRWNPKFGLCDLENGLLTTRTSEGAQWIFPKIYFFNQGKALRKWAIARLSRNKICVFQGLKCIWISIAYFGFLFLGGCTDNIFFYRHFCKQS